MANFQWIDSISRKTLANGIDVLAEEGKPSRLASEIVEKNRAACADKAF